MRRLCIGGTHIGNIGGLLAKTDGGNYSSYYYHYDGSGNVVQLTDASQVVRANYAYDAFGNIKIIAVGGPQYTQAQQPYRFSTKEVHSSSGLYDFGFRFYMPGDVGRWIRCFRFPPLQEPCAPKC